MKKNNILKAFTLSMIMILGLVMPMTAQNNDYFFRGYNNEEDLYENRGETAIEGAFWNQQFGQELPLGSGLLIMVAAGAGYAVSRRRRSMRKAGTMLLALAMILTFTQCKKTIETITTQGKTFISLDVENNSRYDINLETGAVTYQVGDEIYVINGGSIIGVLECDDANGKHFSGYLFDEDIVYHKPHTIVPSDGLHFYFVGDKDPDIDENGNFYVDMSDQSVDRPLLSYGHCAYDASVTKYRCGMRNKCALVEFELNVETAENAVVRNLPTRALLDFSGDIVPMSTTGGVKLHREDATHQWAYLLAQDDAITTSVMLGVDIYSNAVTVPAIENNNFLNGDNTLQITISGDPVQIDKTWFSIGTDEYIKFATGNLQYCPNSTGATEPPYTGAWRFAEHQYDVIGANNANIDPAYTGWIDLFGWGTGDEPTRCTTEPADYPTFEDWGDYCGDVLNDNTTWRAMTGSDWSYLMGYDGNEDRQDKCAPAEVCGISGLLLLPNLWECPTGCSFTPISAEASTWDKIPETNVYNSSQWALMEGAGAMFFPGAGNRTGTDTSIDLYPVYWSSTPYTAGPYPIPSTDYYKYAWRFEITSVAAMYATYRYVGCSVRLVSDIVY